MYKKIIGFAVVFLFATAVPTMSQWLHIRMWRTKLGKKGSFFTLKDG
ncbi:hypothetical protein [Paenibacillus andongensis]|nr:hypothetical protein [Paenibacillus andongensis]